MQVNSLTVFPECRNLEVGDYHLVTPLLKEFPQDTSDHNFTNIYAWRYAHNYRISRLDDMIVVCGNYDGQFYILPPIGPLEKVAETAYRIFELSAQTGAIPLVATAPEWLAKKMKKRSGVKVFSDRSNWDYVYKSSDLAELGGPRYHSKRNLIKQFESSYKVGIEELDTRTCAEAIEFSDRWCQQRDCESDEGLAKEKCAIFQMLSHFEALRLHGILLRLEGEIVGLTMGEELTPNTYVVHVEKGDQHLRGIYQFINQQLAMRVAKDYEWLNREQDLGVEGLRKAKTSYHPDHFVKKYRIEYIK